MLETAPVGRHRVYVCTNISCSLRGADELYEAIARGGRAATTRTINVRSFECLGACDIAPMASVDGVYVGPLSLADVPRLLEDLRAAARSCPSTQLARRLRRRPARQHARVPGAPARARAGAVLMAAPADSPILLLADIDEPGLGTLEVYERRGGYEALRKALTMTPEEVVDAARSVRPARPRRRRLRDGHARSRSCPRATMDKYLVCNADESEPGTFKDRELMQKTPHMLIEGIVIASYAAGANRSFIYIRGEYELQADALDAALAEARAAGLHRRGHPRLRTLARRSSLHRGAGAYICGEETGLLDSLEGKRGNPRLKPPVPGDPGPLPGADADQQRRDALDGAARSSAWAARSTPSSASRPRPGTKLVSVSGHVQRPGNYEIELGIPAREIIYGLAGGPPDGRAVKCWFPGGSSLAGADRRRPRHPLRLRLARQGRHDARLGRDHRRRRLDADPRRRAEARASSTATSPAASARPAARAPTGR